MSIDDGMLSIDNSCGCGECYPADALAVILRAGLDPEHSELEAKHNALAIAAAELAVAIRKNKQDAYCGWESSVGEHVEIDNIEDELKKLEALL